MRPSRRVFSTPSYVPRTRVIPVTRTTANMNPTFHVLIVDDEDAIQRTVRGVLEDEGYRTSSIGDGNAVLPAIRQLKPDAVLLDIWLPGLDGIQLLRDIKKVSPDIEIVMISGHANVHTAVQAVKLGAFDFIEKPLSREQLLLTLARALEHRRLVRENRELRSRIMEAGNTPAPVFRTNFAAQVAEAMGPSVLPGPPDPQGQRQRTLRRSMVVCGQGLHSGIKGGLILTPLPPGSGILFGSIATGKAFPAHLDHVRASGYATTLGNDGVEARTVEHFLATLHSYGITNLLVKMDGEVPIMDGSAVDFCRIIEDAGIEEQDARIEPIRVSRKYVVGDESPDGEYIAIEPSDQFSVRYVLDYPPPVGHQDFTFVHQGSESFRDSIAPARTFGFVKDVRMLAEMGLAGGGRIDNFILIDDEKIVNTTLRFPDELARHKVLDVIGDLYLLGRPMLGKVTAQKTGHGDNIALLKQIRADLSP